MRALVTVGATAHFDLLVEAVLSSEVLECLLEKGYDKLVVQVGPSTHFGNLSEQRGGVSLEMWKLKPSLKEDFAKSDLIISHAGGLQCLLLTMHFSYHLRRFWFHSRCSALGETFDCRTQPNLAT